MRGASKKGRAQGAELRADCLQAIPRHSAENVRRRAPAFDATAAVVRWG